MVEKIQRWKTEIRRYCNIHYKKLKNFWRFSFIGNKAWFSSAGITMVSEKKKLLRDYSNNIKNRNNLQHKQKSKLDCQQLCLYNAGDRYLIWQRS